MWKKEVPVWILATSPVVFCRRKVGHRSQLPSGTFKHLLMLVHFISFSVKLRDRSRIADASVTINV